MTELEGVNELLSRAGMRPVSSLDPDGASWASQAQQLLAEETLSVLTKGWNFNHIKNVEWTPDGNGHIDVPDTVIWVDTYGYDQHRSVSMRSRRLYDKDNNTDVWTGPVRVEYVEHYEFHCLEQHIQEFITARAAIRLCEEANVNSRKLQLAQDNLVRKNSHAHRIEGRHNNTNIITSSDMARLHGYRNNVNRTSP